MTLYRKGDRVTWDRGDLPKGHGTVETTGEIDGGPLDTERWYAVRDDRNTLYRILSRDLRREPKKRDDA